MRVHAYKFFWFIVIIQMPLLMTQSSVIGRLFNVEIEPTITTAAAATVPSFVDENHQPLIDQTIRVLCYRSDESVSPFLDLILQTDDGGLSLTRLPDDCNYIAALHLLREQAGKNNHGTAYQLYNTSWAAGESTPQQLPAVGEIEISSANRLVLFNIVVSLEWEPEPGSTYVEEFYRGLSAASAYLYDMSEGQMAIGDVTIETNGRRWEDADIRIRAANDYRPSAYVGGIVAEPTKYDIAGTNDDPVYAPGAIYLGRYWNGKDAFDPNTGRWNFAAGIRTIIHEWAHYALFLYDEYQQDNGTASYCVCDDLPNGDCGHGDLVGSLMAYHYTADELWFTPLHGEPAACLNTDQWHVHGQSDWDTLLLWPQIQGGTESLRQPTNLTAGPILGLTADLFDQIPAYAVFVPAIHQEGDPLPPAEQAVTVTAAVEVDEAVPADSKLPARVYVLQDGGAEAPDRILYHGVPIGGTQPSGELGELDLFGVTSQEEARAFVHRYATNNAPVQKSYIYPQAGTTAAGLGKDLTLTAVPEQWLASVDLTYELSGTLFTTMTVHLTSAQAVDPAPTIRLCASDAAVGCAAPWQQTMTDQGGGLWTASFNPLSGEDELPLYAVVHIKTEDFGDRIVHYQVAGGVGPAHIDAYAPLRDGQTTVSTDINYKGDGECNRVFIATADNFASRINTLGQVIDEANNLKDVGGILAWPVDIDIVIPDGTLGCNNNTPEDHELQVPMILTQFYSANTLAELGLTSSSQLHILHFERLPSPTAGRWMQLTTIDAGDNLNWLSAEITKDGIYAIGWTP